MNAVEIEEAVSELASLPFDEQEFPFAFLAAFGNKDTTIKRLRSGTSNKSDVDGILQRSNIHLAVVSPGDVDEKLSALRESSQTKKAKAKFVLATDGERVEAEELASGDVLSCGFSELGDHFGFFLSLAGISAVQEIKNNPIDIKATSRLNKLYVELVRDNPDWATADRRHELNQFMARLIFCFFAEDTGVFNDSDLFTNTLKQMTVADGKNTHEVLQELFVAMDRDPRPSGRKLPVKSWADKFPYVNGGLFTGTVDCPRFSRTARSYLLRAGELNWQTINPDIFGSMIQAVADDEERGALGMHYTSVPNIEKVLNPLFLDSLREQLEAAGDNGRKLLNLRKRLSTIRVFDPACGSGNFLVVAYIRMRDIEAELMRRRGEPLLRSSIELTQLFGIEIKEFAVEIARLSLLIAEFQCNVRLIGQKQAQMLVLPLHETGKIVAGNALLLDWIEVCPPDDELAETYICGNPPYLGSQWQSEEQKTSLKTIFSSRSASWKSMDYVSGWFMKAADYGGYSKTKTAFVSTNSLCQGRHVEALWPLIFGTGSSIAFAYTSFKWANLASNNAGVIVVIVGISKESTGLRAIYTENLDGGLEVQNVSNINAYLAAAADVFVTKRSKPLAELTEMGFGSMPNDGGNLLLSSEDLDKMSLSENQKNKFIRRVYGSAEYIRGLRRYCLWIPDALVAEAALIPSIEGRVQAVKEARSSSSRKTTRELANVAHRFGEVRQKCGQIPIVIPSVSSETREFLPVGLLDDQSIVTNLAFALYDAPLWSMALIASRIHLVWIATVCGKMKTDFRYSNTLGWNTFPVPTLTETNKADLTRCAEDILLAREAHFPATIADLYDPEKMPADLRAAHERNDETLERIYIGRRFKNDTERLEKLFALYTEMTQAPA